MPHPRFPSDEIARRGRALYDEKIRAEVEEGNFGKIVVIDIETGEYEIGDNTKDDSVLELAHRMLAKHPDAALYMMRVGYKGVGRIGATDAMARL